VGERLTEVSTADSVPDRVPIAESTEDIGAMSTILPAVGAGKVLDLRTVLLEEVVPVGERLTEVSTAVRHVRVRHVRVRHVRVRHVRVRHVRRVPIPEVTQQLGALGTILTAVGAGKVLDLGTVLLEEVVTMRRKSRIVNGTSGHAVCSWRGDFFHLSFPSWCLGLRPSVKSITHEPLILLTTNGMTTTKVEGFVHLW
jgi:hypothetical protein